MFKLKYQWFKNLIIILGSVWLLSYFGWLLYEITLFTENFDILNIISNDETIFHAVIQEHRRFMERGEWALFFTQTHAVYGNWYWSLLLFLTHPFYQLGLDSIVIMIPRLLSWLSSIWCLFLMDWILRSKRVELSLRILFLILPTTCVGLLITTTPFQTNLPLAAVLMTSFTLLWSRDGHQFPWLASVLFGLGLGLKLPAVLYYPLFVVMLGGNLRHQIKASVVIAVVAVFTFSPLVIFYPLGLQEASRCIDEFKLILSWNSQNHSETQSFWSYIQNGFIFYQYHWMLLVVPLFWVVRDIVYRSWRWPLCYLAYLSAAVVIALKLKTDLSFMTYYTTTGIFLLPLFLFKEVKNSFWMHFILMVLIGHNFFVDQIVLTNRLIDVYRLRYADNTQAAYKNYKELKSLFVFKETDKPLMDWLMAFPANAVRSNRHYPYYYTPDNPEEKVWRNSNLFAFHHLSSGWTQECGNVLHDQNLNKCYFTNKVIRIHPHAKVIFNSAQYLVLQTE